MPLLSMPLLLVRVRDYCTSMMPQTVPPAGPPSRSLLPPSIEQPRTAPAPQRELPQKHQRASSLRPSNSLAQRELHQKQPLLSLYRAAPRIHKASRKSETASSLSQLSSPAQREAGASSQSSSLRAPPVLPPPSLYVWRSTDANSRVRLSKEGTAFHMHHSSSFRI